MDSKMDQTTSKNVSLYEDLAETHELPPDSTQDKIQEPPPLVDNNGPNDYTV